MYRSLSLVRAHTELQNQGLSLWEDLNSVPRCAGRMQSAKEAGKSKVSLPGAQPRRY